MADKKFYHGKVATKITNEMVGKSLIRLSGISFMPEFRRDSEGKLERDEAGKAIVDTSKPIIKFGENEATFVSKVNLTKSQMKVVFKEEATEAMNIYLNVTVKDSVVLEGLKRAFDKDSLKTDTALSCLMLCEKDGTTYKAELLDWEFAPYRRSNYNGEWARPVTDTIVGRTISRVNYVGLVPEFKRDADGKFERDDAGKAIVDSTKPLINFEGAERDAKARFKISPYLSHSVASAFFDEDIQEGTIYISVTAFGYTAVNMQRANETNPFDRDSRFNFDLFTKKNGDFYNGQVLSFARIPAKTEDTEGVGESIIDSAMNAPESAPTSEATPTETDTEMEFPF